MDIVKENQEIIIGKNTYQVVRGNKWWLGGGRDGGNRSAFTQFNITKQDIYDLLGYSLPGDFPPCNSAEDLTKVIEFILSKDPANQVKKEDYTGRTIKALVESPESTGVKLGDEIRIVQIEGNDRYELARTARGTSNLHIARPLLLKHWKLLPESVEIPLPPVVDMKKIQEICIKKYPIGCEYKKIGETTNTILKKDTLTYTIHLDKIYAHDGGGCLYNNGEYAELVSSESIENNFIVGKWYKYKDWYIKYKETVNGLFKSSEEITNYKKYYKSTNSYGEADHEKVLLEDLSEIQQYLPDGHPDKTPIIVKPISKEYIKGKWYGSKKWGPKSFVKLDYISDEKVYFTERINEGVYAVRSDWWSIATYELVEADMKEISKYLLPSIIKTIPEYIECIEVPNGWSITKKGKIYRIDSFNSDNGHFRIKFDEQDGGGGQVVDAREINCFKPSTNEAYNAQFKRNFKVGDWVITTEPAKGKYYNKPNEGEVFQVTSVERQGHLHFSESESVETYRCRHATPLEIQTAFPGKIEIKEKSNIFVLPEKWYIKDCEEVSKYAVSKWKYNGRVTNRYYCENTKTYYFCEKHQIPSDYKEITLAQFKQYVLIPVSNQQNMYAFVGDPISPTKSYLTDNMNKSKSLIDDVQSVSVNLSTKKNNKNFKF